MGLKIIYSVFEHTETHALNAVRENLFKQKQYGRDPDLPLIPDADKAHFAYVCEVCDKNRVWVLGSQYPGVCEECKPKVEKQQQEARKKQEDRQLAQERKLEQQRLQLAHEFASALAGVRPSQAVDPMLDPAPPTPPNSIFEDAEAILKTLFGKVRGAKDSANR